MAIEPARRGPKALKLLLVLTALGAGAWFGRGYLPDEARAPIDAVGAKVQELVQDDDPRVLKVGQRFVYKARGGAARQIEVTRIDDDRVHVHPSMRRGDEVVPDVPPHQRWSHSTTREFLRGMGLGPMREDTLVVSGVEFPCQVYESSRVPFRIWLSERFPGVVRVEKSGELRLELERIEQVVSSERVEWAAPTGSWTLWF